MMNCIETIFDRLYIILEDASNEENILKDFTTGNVTCNTGYKIKPVIEIAVVKLKEYFERFIRTLNIQNPFLFLGRDIRSFADAAFVVSNLKPLIIAKLYSSDKESIYMLIDDVTSCCSDLKSLLVNTPTTCSY